MLALWAKQRWTYEKKNNSSINNNTVFVMEQRMKEKSHFMILL